MWNNSNRTVQLFLNNKLDKDVQRIFQPFNIILSIFFTSKYKIRNSYITPCEKKYHLLLFFTILFCNIFYTYRLFDDKHSDFAEFNKTSIALAIFWYFNTMYYLSYILLIICKIVYSRSDVALILKIQDIHRSIDISKNVQSYIIWNWISLFTILGIFILPATFFYVTRESIYFNEATSDLLMIQYDLNLIYGIRLTTLLTTFLKEWTKYIPVINNEEQSDEYCNQFFKTYQNILEAYKLHTKCFRVLILYRTCDSFLRGLCFVEVYLIQLQASAHQIENSNTWTLAFSFILRHLISNIMYCFILKKISFSPTSLSVLLIILIAKFLSLILLSCWQYEKFYISVEEAESACIQRVMYTNCPETSRHLCERVVQANRTFSKMTAYGLFTIDATLPIPLIGLLANYIIVLLQFAFL